MKKQIIRFLIAGICVVTLIGCHRTPEEKAEYVIEHLTDELELNESQVIELNKIKDSLMEERKSMKKVRTQVVDELIASFSEEELDSKKIDQVLENSQQNTNKLLTLIKTQFVKFHSILNAEQRAKVTEFLKKHKKRMERRHK